MRYDHDCRRFIREDDPGMVHAQCQTSDPLYVLGTEVAGHLLHAYRVAWNTVTRWSHLVGQALKH